ncbi:MAG: restriction endonuclease subunit S, partial [bacterium]|nr:restriction endonuclease subunit S [bacterium]
MYIKGNEHTEFKETKIGKIPKEWEVIAFRDILDVKSGYGFGLKEYVTEGIRLIKIDNVSWGRV